MAPDVRAGRPSRPRSARRRRRKAQAEYEAFMTSQGLPVQPEPRRRPRRRTCARSARCSSSPSRASRTRSGRRSTTAATCSTPATRTSTGRPPEVEDAGASATRISAAERAARDRARAPFRAAGAAGDRLHPLRHDRPRRSSRTSSRALQSSGLAAHPERVFGVYRVPDRHDLSRKQEGKALRRVGDRAPAGRAPAGRGRGPDRRLQARGPLGGAPAGRAVGARRGRRGRADRPRAGRARGLLRPAPAAQRARRATPRTGTTWTPVLEGVLLFTRPLAAIAAAQRQMTAQAPLALAARRRSTSRSSTGRRSPPGSHRTATARSASRRRSRTCRAPGRSCSRPTWRSSACAARTATACRSRAPPTARSPTSRWRAPKNLRQAKSERRRRRATVMHVAEHVVIAYRDRAEYEAGPGALARLPAPGPARPARPPDRRAAADRGRRPPAPVVPRPRSSTCSTRSAPCRRFPQIFNRNAAAEPRPLLRRAGLKEPAHDRRQQRRGRACRSGVRPGSTASWFAGWSEPSQPASRRPPPSRP